MGIVSGDELEAFVAERLRIASDVARNRLVVNESVRIRKSLSLSHLPEFADMENSFGYGGWAVNLSVDLRGSSARAVRVGPRDTFATMHTYLPTMAFLVGKAGGYVVGLRGDGLFAAFGLKQAPARPRRTERTEAALAAVNCGEAMLRAIDDFINPALELDQIQGGLKIGIGIAVGNIVVTRIGWAEAQEVTAYGPPVNIACKFRGRGVVLVTDNVFASLPPCDDEENPAIVGVDIDGGKVLAFTEDAEPVIDE